MPIAPDAVLRASGSHDQVDGNAGDHLLPWVHPGEER
jgi:hypothetical protein